MKRVVLRRLIRVVSPLVATTVASVCWGAGAVRVLSESADGLVLRVETPQLETSVGADGRLSLGLPGHGRIRSAGHPELPRITIPVALPAGRTARLRVHEGDAIHSSAALAIWHPAPGAFDAPAVAGGDGLWPEQSARIAWSGSLRGRGLALIEFFPVRWSAATGQIATSPGATIEIDFVPGEVAAGADGVPRAESTRAPFAGLLERLVVNPSAAARREIAAPGRSPDPPLSAAATTGLSAKLLVSRDDMYRVTGADLTAAGIDLTGIDPRNLELHDQGAVVDIRIEGEEDGVFDPGDTLVFHGLAVDTRFSGTNVYWLESAAGLGARMASRSVAPGGGTPLTSFRAVVRQEESVVYTSLSPPAQPAEHWWWERLDAPANVIFPAISDSYRVTLADLPAAAGAARLRFNVQGRTIRFPQPDHNTLLYVNGTQVDDQLWNGIDSFTHDVLFDASLLIEGENVISVEHRQVPGIDFASLYTNWFSLEYDDSFVADSDRLSFSLSAGPATVRIQGFGASGAEVHDVSDPLHPVLLTGAVSSPAGPAWELELFDSPAASASYVAALPSAMAMPDAILQDEITSWKSAANGADMIFVIHEDFAGEIQPLVDLRSAEGLRTAVVLVEDIMDEFAFGLYTPEAIQDFLEYAYFNWQPPAPAFVLLVGDANLDYRDYLGHGGDFVPTNLVSVPGTGEVMSDNSFARVDGGDLLPDLYIGRLPVRTPAQAQTIVNRILDYSVNPPTTQVSSSLVLVADDGLSVPDPTFESILDSFGAFAPPSVTRHKIYASQFGSNSAICNEITTRLNAGALVTVYAGHGNIDIWGSKLGDSGFFWSAGDLNSLSNDAWPTFTLSLNCINGYFGDFSTASLGENWLTTGLGGGLGGWAPSGLGSIDDMEILGQEFFRRLYDEHDAGIGSATVNALIRAFTQFGIAADNMDEMILFGDPSQFLALDADQDGLSDAQEAAVGSDPGDADSDEDGLLDGQEPSWSSDIDGDGLPNLLDPDSDGDGLPDGLEAGVASAPPSTDVSAGYFVADLDPASTTDPLLGDTDGGGAPDGIEDADVNGRLDAGESDPNLASDDPACSAAVPPEVTGLVLAKSGGDVVAAWEDLSVSDPCVVYEVYLADNAAAIDSFDVFGHAGTVNAPAWVHPGAAADNRPYHYLVTGSSLAAGEGPVGHYGQ